MTASFGVSQAVADAFVSAGHSAVCRFDRNGSRRVSLDGGRETDMRAAMRKIEATLTKERAWPWQHRE